MLYLWVSGFLKKVESVLSFILNNNPALGLYITLGWTNTQMVPSSIWVRPLSGHIKPQKVRFEFRQPNLI
jgi:hypothetical protein